MTFPKYQQQGFYDDVRSGEMPTTSQVNAEDYIRVFRPFLEQKRPVIYLCSHLLSVEAITVP